MTPIPRPMQVWRFSGAYPRAINQMRFAVAGAWHCTGPTFVFHSPKTSCQERPFALAATMGLLRFEPTAPAVSCSSAESSDRHQSRNTLMLLLRRSHEVYKHFLGSALAALPRRKDGWLVARRACTPR